MKYVYFHKNNLISIYTDDINDLKTEYFTICNKIFVENGMAEEDFNSNMENDGYIIAERDSRMSFFIEIDKINNIFSDLEIVRPDIIEIIKNAGI